MSDADIIGELLRVGLIANADVTLQPLTGGVSCDVWKVETLRGMAVIKRPLPQLRVAAEWFAPVERGDSEVAWLKRANEIDPTLVPEVWAELPHVHGFAMRFFAGSPVWKDELVAGRVDSAFAAAVGRGIASIHSATANNDNDRAAFANDAQFHALRVDPFLLYVAEHDTELAPVLRGLADDLSARKVSLVHGDVSPKNILVGEQGPVFLDAECASYGDPAFDLAFCTTHLLLKAIWLDDERLRVAAIAFVDAYRTGVDWEDANTLLARAGKLLAALLLARVEGKSPAPYLSDPDHKHCVLEQARHNLFASAPIDVVAAGWKRTIL